MPGLIRLTSVDGRRMDVARDHVVFLGVEGGSTVVAIAHFGTVLVTESFDEVERLVISRARVAFPPVASSTVEGDVLPGVH